MIRRRIPRYYKGEFKDIIESIFSGRIPEGGRIKVTQLQKKPDENRHCEGEARSNLFFRLLRRAKALLAMTRASGTELLRIKSFEDEFARYIGVRFALATCSGRSGLSLLLDAFKLKPGDEVIMPAYTLKDLVRLIQDKGLVPKLVDIESDSFNMDPELISAEITSRTKVIVATHLFGLPCAIERILKIAKEHDIAVIEDCAHALGSRVNGKRAGSFADAAFFSFETTKAINTFGGGMITTNDEDIARHVRALLDDYPLREHNVPAKILFSCLEDVLIRSPAYTLLARAFINKHTAGTLSRIYLSLHNAARIDKARFTGLQALLGLKQLNLLDERNSYRDRIAAAYEKMLDRRIVPQRNTIFADRIFYFFVVKLPVSRPGLENIRGRLIRAGVDAGIKAEITDNCAIYLGQEERYPVAKEIYESAMQLPMHDELIERDVSIVADAVNKCLPSLRARAIARAKQSKKEIASASFHSASQ